ncbi:MAG: DUF1349 domain-containing protein [Anaerolineae bacterium]|jgi:beta-xylosidase
MTSKALQRAVSVFGILLLLVGFMAFPPRGPVPSSAAVYDYFWRDDFGTDTLHPLWSWIREDDAHWSLTDNPDFLRIITQEGGIIASSNDQNNILVTDAPSGDFEITTQVIFDPAENFQYAAIQVYQDDDNYIQLNRAWASGDKVNFDKEIGGTVTNTQTAESADTIWLRITRELNTYTGYFSTDGVAWTLAGQYTAYLPNAKIGLAAANNLAGVTEIPADFEYFELRAMFPSFGRSWSDDFAASLVHPAWSWINEDPAFWSLTDRPGFMRLTTYAGAPAAKNLLVLNAPVGTYAITTRLLFEPTSNFQIAGLVIYGAGDDFLMFGRAMCDLLVDACVGNGIYFDNVDGGGFNENYATSVPDPGEVFLRVVREGRSYSGYVSPDGADWMLVGRHTVSGSRALHYIGISSGNDQADLQIPADFDYFELLDNYAVFMPLVMRAY